MILMRRLPKHSDRISFFNNLIQLIDTYNKDIDIKLIGFPQNYKDILSKEIATK